MREAGGEAWALLAFDSADLEQDEAVTTSAFMADQTAGKSERVGEVQKMPHKPATEASISDRGTSAQMLVSSTGMTNYRKCKRVVRIADGRSLKIVGFGDICDGL